MTNEDKIKIAREKEREHIRKTIIMNEPDPKMKKAIEVVLSLDGFACDISAYEYGLPFLYDNEALYDMAKMVYTLMD